MATAKKAAAKKWAPAKTAQERRPSSGSANAAYAAAHVVTEGSASPAVGHGDVPAIPKVHGE